MECDEFLTRNYGSDMRRFVEIFGALILAAILIATVASAKQSNQYLREGTAADFAVTFPWVVVGLITMLFALLAWFISRYDAQREKKLDAMMVEIGNTNANLSKATDKLDETIVTLFNRDRDIEHAVFKNTADISSIQATCRTRGEMCKIVHGDYIGPERRKGEPRRATNGVKNIRQDAENASTPPE